MARYKLVYDDPSAFKAAMAIENFPADVLAVNPVRRALSIEANEAFLDGNGQRMLPEGVRIAPETQYDLETGVDFSPFDFLTGPDIAKEGDMDLVLDLIHARDAWRRTQGQGVTLAVIDTGVDGKRPEFGAHRRGVGLGVRPWEDANGHGTMCAAIAAGSRADGGVIDGVAPQARVLACRTSFGEVELSAIYDGLTGLRANGEIVVATNSFGMKMGTPPVHDPEDLFVLALGTAIDAGVHVFFSAGNNHTLAGGRAQDCDPNSVWLYKSRQDVFAVATCDQDLRMWDYSSRGPGQFFGAPGMSQKPDVTAPTPRNGEIVWGNGLSVLGNGWGTSGACPQVAGLAALLLSLDPGLTSEVLFDYIRQTARNLGFGPDCQGAGLIDCSAAVGRI